MRRWVAATLAGSMSAALIAGIMHFGMGMEFGHAALAGGGIGLVIALLVARWYTTASRVMSVVEVIVSALAALVSILAAAIGVFS